MLTSQTLRTAQKLIDTPNKWCKFYFREGTAMCATGCINLVARGHPASMISEDDPQRCLWIAIGCPQSSIRIQEAIARWNNAPERTPAEVMAVFGRAIDLAEADEASQAAPAPREAVTV